MNESGFGSLHMPRSRGAVSGLLVIILGGWGALAPFVGPFFHFAYPPGEAWVWSTARAWLEVLPGAVAAIGGLLLLISGHRVTAMLGAWLAVIAGAWFVVGRTLAPTLRLGDVGQPIAATELRSAAIEIASFSGVGVLIVFLGGAALARVSTRTVRDYELIPEIEPIDDAPDVFHDHDATTAVGPTAATKHRRAGLLRRALTH